MAYDEGVAYRIREKLDDHSGIAEDDDLLAWLELGLRHAASLPPKQGKAAGKRPVEKKAATKKAAKKPSAAGKPTRGAAAKRRRGA